ncbi:MAG: hypothetical protein ABI721_05540 [Candidatus Dojkabacteria bacterium]
MADNPIQINQMGDKPFESMSPVEKLEFLKKRLLRSYNIQTEEVVTEDEFQEESSVEVWTLEESLEGLKNQELLFRILGYVGAQVWFSDKPDKVMQEKMLATMESRMKIGYDSAPFTEGDEINEDQFVEYLNFTSQKEISNLYDLFDSIGALNDGVIVISIFHITTINRNMFEIVAGMKAYLRESLGLSAKEEGEKVFYSN